MEIKDMIELMRAVSENGLTTFELEQDDWKMVMKCEEKLKTVFGHTAEENPAGGCGHVQTGQESVTGAVHETEKEISGNIVKCPLVGTFYSAPSPETESFVKVGDHVKKGQILGIVEAMKLMNEIESEYDGVVGQIFVENGEMVEYGQPMFEIR